MPASAAQLFAWHARPGALRRLLPPWAPVKLERHEGILDGDRAVLRLGLGRLSVPWVAEHHDYRPGEGFSDLQVKGPFPHWDQTHRMIPDGPDGSVLEDRIDYVLPFGGLGEKLGNHPMKKQLAQQFTYRHETTRQDLQAHEQYGQRRLRIAVSGASGLIGSALVPFLTTGGHEVLRLVRSRPKGEDEVYWNHRDNQIEAEKLEGLDAVVHLAGESVFALRWNEAKKMRILGSRVNGTRFLSQTLARLERPPRVLLSASAIGYYGNRGDAVLTESSAPGETGFLPAVTRDWEAATAPAAEAGIRTAHMRMGIVLSPEGGALNLMLPLFRLGLGGKISHEQIYMSWIALDDVVYAVYHLMATDGLSGAFNFVSPNPTTLAAFTKTLARVLGRPAFMQVPAPVVRAVSGEAADEMFLASARVRPAHLLESGYAFRYPDLEASLRHLLGRRKEPIEEE